MSRNGDSIISRRWVVPMLTLVAFLLSACATSEIRAVKTGDLNGIREYVETGGDVNRRYEGGMTLLMFASAGGYVHIIDYLVSAGADVRYRDTAGRTALLHGAINDRQESVASLIAYSADPDSADNQGGTAILYAAARDFWQIVDILLNRGADYQMTDGKGWTPILAALNNSAAAPSGLNRSYGFLTDAGAEFDVIASVVPSIAFVAAASGNVDVLELLFGRGLSTDLTDASGNSLLHAGVKHLAVIEFLIARGIDVDGLNNEGQTPLILAARKEYRDSVFILIGEAAKPDIRDTWQKSALLYAAGGQDVEILRTLIGNGAFVFLQDSEGNTALHMAAASGNARIAQLLLDEGVPVNTGNSTDQTAYDRTFDNGSHGEAIRGILVAAGAVIPQVVSETTAEPAAEAGAGPNAEPDSESEVVSGSESPGIADEGTTSVIAAEAVDVEPSGEPADESTSEPSPVEDSVETTDSSADIDETPTEAAVAEETSAGQQQSTAAVYDTVTFAWPMINPSRSRGWNNSDKITGEATMLVRNAKTGEIRYSGEISLPLKGVNADAHRAVLDLQIQNPEDLRGILILETRKGNRLRSEIDAHVAAAGVEFYFENFEYLN